MNKNHKENLKVRNQKEVTTKYRKITFKEYFVTQDSELLTYLVEKLGFSRNNAKSLLSHHLVGINGAPVSQFNFLLYKGDSLIVSKNPIKKKERKDLPIVYEDDDVIVINKPSGLLSVASDREKNSTAYRMVCDYIHATDKQAHIFVVHRIDKETSGILMFAKNKELQVALQDNWNDIVKKRGYYAIVEGRMEKPEDTIVNYLRLDSLKMMQITRDTKRGQKCITSYKVIKDNPKFSLLNVNIMTGRKNQIRVTLGSLGHYVVGDDKYGNPVNPIHRLCLHAYELDLLNPLTKKEYKFNAPIPKEFIVLIK